MYRSPIRLAGLEPGAGFDKQSLSLARKKMLAELELGDGHAIMINGTELNRQDIARLFDELANERQLSWHTAIANDNVLLHFLETGEIHAFGPGWAENDLYDDPGFRHFVSPYIAAAMSVMFQKIVSDKAGNDMLTKFLRQRSLLSIADHDAAYGKITRYFLEVKNRILLCLHRVENPPVADDMHRPATSGKVTKEEIDALCTDNDLFVLNQLPEEFDDLRYSIVDALNDICVACDHLGNPALAYAAISKAAAIRCESLHELVQKNKAVVYDKMQPRSYRTSTPPKKEQPLRWIGLVIFLFITIARLAGSSSCNQSTRNNIYPSYSTTVSSPVSDPEAIPDLRTDETRGKMDTYKSLIASLDGLEDNTQPAGYEPDTVVKLVYKQQNGTDVLANAWQALSLPTIAELPESDASSGNVLVDNRSSWPAIAIYTLNENYFRSAYIAPHAQYNIRYFTPIIHVNIYSGNKWSDKVTNTVLVHTGNSEPAHIKLVGGFKEHSTFIKSAMNSFFYRQKEFTQSCSDVILIKDDKTYGTIFEEERGTLKERY